jgi:hypothetical protein
MDYNRTYTLDQSYFEKIDNEEKAYVLGLMYSDGNVSWNDIRHQYEFCICLHKKDSYLLEKVTKLLGSNAPLKFYKNACVIKFSSKKMCGDLINLGCVPKKSLILKFPTEEQVPDCLLSHFIRGVFDGDGTISKKTNRNTYRVGFCGSKSFILSLRKKLEDWNIFSTFLRNYDNPLFKELTYGTFEAVELIYNMMYNNSSIYLKRKRDRFDDFFYLKEKFCRIKYIEGILHKICPSCKEFKQREEFDKFSVCLSGRTSFCKKCLEHKSCGT